MKSMGIKVYTADVWNINDIIIIIVTIAYATLRLCTEKLRVNFLPINDFEFIDAHLETEVVIDML